MKRVVAVLLSVIMAVSLSSCAASSDGTNSNKADKTTMTENYKANSRITDVLNDPVWREFYPALKGLF